MKERPILFSPAMARALLEGRKVQTRRVVRLPRWAAPGTLEHDGAGVAAVARASGCLADVACPYGSPGDRLWCRERFRYRYWDEEAETISVEYADGATRGVACGDDDVDAWLERQSDRFGRIRGAYVATGEDGPAGTWQLPPGVEVPWQPSIHMPRWAARLVVEVTGVRVERVQSIADGDVAAEGLHHDEDYWYGGTHPVKKTRQCWATARRAFQAAWDDLHAGDQAWAANPLVWVIELRVLEALGKKSER